MKRGNAQSLHAHNKRSKFDYQAYRMKPDKKPILWKDLYIYWGNAGITDPLQADPNREWYVKYEYYFNGEWNPVFVRRGLNRIHTLKEKIQAADDLKEVIEEELKEGYNPVLKKFPDLQGSHEVSAMNFKDALTWAISKNPRKIGKRTKQAYATNIKHFSECLKLLGHHHIPISGITKWHLYEAYDKLKEKGLAPQTVNDYLTNLTHLFKILFKRGVVESNPAEFLDKMPVGEVHKRKRPTEEEMKIIKDELSVAPYGYMLFINIEHQTAIRPKEIRLLQVEELDLDNLYIHLVPENGPVIEKTKNRRPRSVPITNKLAALIREQIKGNTNPKAFVIGKHFKCGEEPLGVNTSSSYWREHIKIKHGLEVDQYSMKHKQSDELTRSYKEFEKVIAGLMGHSDNGELVRNVYNADKSVIDNFLREHITEL